MFPLVRSLPAVALDHFFEHSSECLAIFDLKGRALRLNSRWERLLGVPLAELEGHSALAYAHPDDVEGMRRALGHLTAGAERTEGCTRARTADGGWRWLAWSGTRQGGLIYVVAHDETAHLQARDELALARASWEGLFNSVTEAVYIQDGSGVFLEVNRAVLEMYGLPRDAFIGRTPEFLAAPGMNDMAAVVEKIGLAFAGQPQRLEFWARRADGEIFPKEVSLSRGDWFGRPVLIAVARDVGERRRAEEALRRSESFMRAVLEASPLGISVRAPDGRLLSCNHAWRRIWAIPDDAVLEDMERSRGDMSLDARDEYSRPWWEELRRIYREGGRLAIPEARTRGRRPGSAEWVSQHFYAIPDEQGRVDRVVVITQDISERKRAEEALRLSERRLAEAVEMARLGHWEYDPQADLFTFNDQFYKVLRTTADQCGGYTMSLAEYQRRFLHPDETHTVAEEDRRARAAASADYTSQIEQHLRFADGDDGWVSVRTFLRKDEQGRTVRTYGVIQDVSERRRAEERLRESGHLLEEAQRLASLGTYSLDVPAGLWQSSRVLDGIFGIPAEYPRDMAGWLAIVHPGDRAELAAYFQEEVLGRRRPFDRQYRIVRVDDGETRWLHGRGELLLDEEGRVRRMFGMIQDITERRQAEEALRESEEHYRRFFEHDLTADYISTADGRLLDCNPAYLRLFGFPDREAALATNVTALYPDGAARGALLDELKSRGGLEYREMVLRNIEGQPLHVIMNVLGVFDGEGRLDRMQGYLFDITQHKELEQQFYQAQKMESIGRLAGGVAHDFNNLLTVINGHVDLMRLQVLPQDPLREQMEQVAAAGERAARLTRQLLAFSRRQVLQLEPVALNQVVNDLGKMLRRLIGEDVRLETRLEAGLPAVLADAGQLEQVLVNLAVNSRDAMPEGGTLTVSTQSLHVDAEFCRLHRPQPPGHYCLLEVSDTGVGMGADVLSRVFEPFFTTKEKGRGTGLGLATVYGIVKQVDGYIWAESEPGRGTTFQIFFPVVHAAVEPRDPRAAAGLLLKGSETVLVVEDEEMVRRLAVRLLRSHGYQVLEADHGREALAVLEANPEVRLVLSDVIMPVMGGRELALNLQARPRPPALIFMSGYTEEDIARQGLVKAGLHFIQKPFDMTTLLQKVRAVLDGH